MAPAASVTLHGVTIPRLGLGTFGLNDEACERAVAGALQAGMRHIDTAERYQNERAVGAGLRASGVPREAVFITSKVWHDHLEEPLLLAAVEASLGRLSIDALDLCLIHWPNPNVPLAQTLGALAQLKRRGLVRSIGVSNFPPALLRDAVALSSEPLVVNQVEYHPYLDQSALLSALRAHQMGLTAYSPLARGRIQNDRLVGEIAARHGASAAAVALSWLLHQDAVLAIPKSQSPERTADNLAALTLSLSEEECAAISRLARPSGRLINPAFAPDWDAV